jgi:hypothetical protein
MALDMLYDGEPGRVTSADTGSDLNRWTGAKMATPEDKPFRRPRHWTLSQTLRHYTDRSGGDDACWPFFGSIKAGGYGQLSLNGRPRAAHRLAWIEANGTVPDGLHVCHKCDNRVCCNPAHLWVGTCKENMEDRERKGRGNQASGENHGKAKLKWVAVLSIRGSDESLSVLAKRHGVNRSVIWQIKRNNYWKQP